MDRLSHTPAQQSFEIPQNLSCKSRNSNPSQETTQDKDSFWNGDHGQISELDVYCMSDAFGRLHFNLSVYPESTLNPSEQRNLGRQLPEYVRDHYEEYRKTHEPVGVLDFFEEESGPTSAVVRALYDDFIAHYPALSLSHQTYVKALHYLSALKKKSFSRVLSSVTQSNFSNHSSAGTQHGSSPMPSHLSDSAKSKSNASNVTTLSGSAMSRGEGERLEADGENLDESERRAQLSDQLNIPRWKDALYSNNKTLSDSSTHEHHPLISPQHSHPSCLVIHKEKHWKQSTHPSPLPTRCSCPTSKCLSLFPGDDRKQICKKFWRGKNAIGNFKWVGASMQGHFPFGLKSHSRSCKARQFFIGKYFLHKPVVGRQEVCKHFFLTTLGLHFMFPLYDVLKQKTQTNLQPKNTSSSGSVLHNGRKSKKRTILKYFMKKHMHRHFLRHCYHNKLSISSVMSRAKNSFKHFSCQYPHLLENKSFKKYLSFIRKALKLMKPTSKGSLSSSTKLRSKTYNNLSEKGQVVSDEPASDSFGSHGKIMKIKAEDFDEVMADDMAEKYEIPRRDACDTRHAGHSGENRPMSSSLGCPKSSLIPAALEEDDDRCSQPINDNEINLAMSSFCPEHTRGKKAKRKPYAKGKRGTSQKKVKIASGKKSSRKADLFLNSHKKSCKIAVNELEDDQAKHPMLPPCNCSKAKCLDKVPEEQRQTVHSDFWNLDNMLRRAWMVKHVHILKPKSRSNRATARLHKMHRKFFLPDTSGELQDVCKRFFLATLGFKGVGVLRPQKIPGAKNSAPQIETRKRVLSYQVCQQDVFSVIQYCKYFSKEKDVRFCGDDRFTRAPNNNSSSSDNVLHQKICVPYGFTWKELFRDYCARHSDVEFGYQTFRSILSLVEQSDFSEDLLDKFQIFVNSDADSVEKFLCESQDNAESEPSVSILQEQCHILQSFPKGQKMPKKTVAEREPVPRVVKVVETETKQTKSRKKLKLSKTFLSHDFLQTVKSYKPRNTCNSRYNFREGVPLVSYSFDNDAASQDDEFVNNDWEDSGYNGIKEEILSDEEKDKKVAKKSTKKSIRLPGRKKKKHKRKSVTNVPVADEPDVDLAEKEGNVMADSLVRKKKIGRRGRKKSFKLKLDTKQQESTIRLKSRHPILPPCKCNYRKCHERIPQAQRENIHSLYWSISSKQDRCKWVLEHIQRCSPKTRSNTGLPSRKRETRRYFFPDEQDETIEVCRVFFLRTLGYQWDSVVDTVSRALPRPGGHLAKSLGFSEQQFPYEVIVQIKAFLKHKKIRKSSVSVNSFPKECRVEENENTEDGGDFTLEGYSMKELFEEFTDLHPDHNLDVYAFKRIVQFILVPSSEAQSEWEVKKEQLQRMSADGTRAGLENAHLGDGMNNGLAGEARNPDGSVVYFTPEFEKLDIEKALTRKARRRRPVSSRNSKEQHPMREPCQCIRKCREKIDQRKREEIHQHYWDLITYNQRKQWILEHIKREAPKRRTNLNGPIKKMETRKFYFEDWSGQKVEICKGFFLSTLGFKWDKMVDTICKTTPRDGQYVRPDQRGKKPPSHKLSEILITSVTNYVESILETASCVYPKSTGRAPVGKQKKTVDRMPYGLTMKNLFEDYKIKHANHKVGYESFRKIYRSVVQSDKFQPSMSSPSQVQDEDDEPAMDHLDQPPQQMTNVSTLAPNIESTSSDRASEQDVSSFDTANQSCMYKSQSGMRLHNPQQAHLAPYQRQCEASMMKPFPEGISSFAKSHDVHFYSSGLEQNEEMSMQMYKSICLPPPNPQQPYAFYPNSLPLDSFPMASNSQGPHGGLPYSDSLRHSDIMHHHPYQAPHHHFPPGRFHGFVFPGSSSASKEADPGHHQHTEMNVNHNYRSDFDCNPYSGKNPLVYPPPYHGADGMPSSSSSQRHYNNLQMQNHGVHEIRVHDSTAVTAAAAAATNLLVNDSSSSNCHIPSSVQSAPSHPSAANEWASHLAVSANREPLEEDPEQRNAKRAKGRPVKRQPKEKIPKVKKEKKTRPKSNRNSREHNPMLPPCGCSVKKCLEKIPEPRREEIYNMFWDLGCYNGRKQWIAEHIVREDPKRRTSLDNPLRRMETRRFFLPTDQGEKLEVCKGFFLRTLGFKWDKMVDTICKTTEKGQTVVRPDMRGKKGPSHKLNPDVATSVENYVRSIVLAAKPAYDATAGQSEEEQDEQDHDKGVFVPYGLTVKNFHEDYKGKHAHHKVGFESFRKIFRRVSKEVLGSVSLQEDDEDNLVPTSAKGGSDVVNPVTGLPQPVP